jgi:hypothetical protein
MPLIRGAALLAGVVGVCKEALGSHVVVFELGKPMHYLRSSENQYLMIWP